MYKVRFYDCTGRQVDYCEFGVGEDEKFLDKLEEVLYIVSELTPMNHREWKKALATHGIATFTYHNVEFSNIVYEWGSKEIEVVDI